MEMDNFPLLLASFEIHREFRHDTWNGIEFGEIHCKLLVDDAAGVMNNARGKQVIGEFNYRVSVGQIMHIGLERGYRGRTLEKQILVYMMKDMQDSGATHIWEVVPNDAFMGRIHYSTLWDFKYMNENVHPSVIGMGYIMEIPCDLRTLKIDNDYHIREDVRCKRPRPSS